MNIEAMIQQIKSRPDYPDCGMILCHNGVVRRTSRDGKPVTGLRVAVDHDRLKQVIEEQRKRSGIIDILVEINAEKDLAVGDDVMFLVVAGDIRENVLDCMRDTIDAIKETVTRKTQFFEEA